MKLSTVADRIPAWYAASNEPKGPSWHLQSKPGRGKTSVLEGAPAILKKAFGDGDYGFSLINGANATLSTLCGYMWPTEHEGVKYSEFTRPYWWFTSESKPLEAYVGGILLVDEEDKLGLDEKKIVGEGALSKVVGGHRLPPGWVVWFAGNLQTDRSGSTKQFDHLINRRNRIKIDDDILSLRDWMMKEGCLPEVIAFAEENTQCVFMDAPDVQGPWMTPRSLVAQDTYLRALMDAMSMTTIPTDATTIEEVAGGVGEGPASQLFATIRLGLELPPYEDIVKHPLKMHMPSKPDALRLAAYKLASRVSNEDADPVLAYMGRAPDEFQVIFVKMAVTRNKRLVMHKGFAAWCNQKASLLAVLGQFAR